MTDEIVVMETRDQICTITLNRPAIMNAWNFDMGGMLVEAFERVAADQGIRVVILQGAGSNFSSGADMFLLRENLEPPEILMGMKELSKLIRTMKELPQPIISKVRGVAYGVGCNFALAGDFVLAAHDARFCEVFVNIGVIMDGGGHYFLPRLVGLAKAKEIALLGEEFDGRTAASVGLIYKSVPAEDLDREAEALALKLSQKSFKALALIKEGLEGSLDMSLKEMMEWEASHQSIMLQTDELKESVSMFLKIRGKTI